MTDGRIKFELEAQFEGADDGNHWTGIGENTYRISSYSFRGNYFLNLEIQRSYYIGPKVTVNKVVETIQGRKMWKFHIVTTLWQFLASLNEKLLRKLFKGGNYWGGNSIREI